MKIRYRTLLLIVAGSLIILRTEGEIRYLTVFALALLLLTDYIVDKMFGDKSLEL